MYTPSIKQQLIKKEAILELFNQMPVSTLLTPNWEEALQANINGSAVVRMPIKNVDRLKDLLPAGLDLELKMPANGKQMSLKTGSTNSQTSTNGANPNYFEQHPPELFIVRDPVSNKLNASLLNFVPTNPTVDFGGNGVWTGTLYEWNLKGEVVWAQEIVKNKLIDRYGLQNPVVENKNSTASSGKVLSLNDKKVSSFFGWLVDLIGDFIGWIAHTLGIPTYGGYPGGCSSCGSGWRIDWGTLGGAGDGGQGGFTGPVDRGDIYGSYIPGYAQGGGSYEPFPNTPGGPNPGSAVIPASTLYLISVLQLTDPVQMDFLATNSNISDRLATYLETNGTSIVNKEFATWAITYLNDNPSFNRTIEGLIEKLFLIKNLELTQHQTNFIGNNPTGAIELKGLFDQDNNFNENKIIAEAIIEQIAKDNNNPSSGAKLDGLINTIKNAVSQSVVSTAIVTRKVYLTLNNWLVDHPNQVASINANIINPIRGSLTVNLNPETLDWRDLFNIWLFELGTYSFTLEGAPAITISTGANVIDGNGFQINALKHMPSVTALRRDIKTSLSSNNVQIGQKISQYYQYDVNEYYGSLLDQNTAKIFLGSFDTEVYVLTKNVNSAKVLFISKNVSGWESATRFIKAAGSSPTGIMNDKSRGAGLNLGGNFGQHIQWSETITW